ncbi:hypothetical protein ACIQNV_37230 [Streptomyces hydrogenans]|uniref:hypothetical protein n=1 Tax=Streptomyces hydrogenans TaxID=1873719 RepID=UPI0037F9371C
MTHADPSPPPRRRAPQQQPDYGVPSPDLVARAEAGLDRFLTRVARDEDEQEPENPEPPG